MLSRVKYILRSKHDIIDPKHMLLSNIPAIICRVDGKMLNRTNKKRPTIKQLAINQDKTKYWI